MRELTAEEVEFEELVEDDYEIPEGVFSTDDPEQDRRDEEAIRSRLARGDNSAWCILVVHARWEGFVGHASVAGFTFPQGQSGRANARYAKEDFEGLRMEALADLNAQLKNMAAKLAKLD